MTGIIKLKLIKYDYWYWLLIIGDSNGFENNLTILNIDLQKYSM